MVAKKAKSKQVGRPPRLPSTPKPRRVPDTVRFDWSAADQVLHPPEEKMTKRTVVKSMNDVPNFRSDSEAAAYWDTHTMSVSGFKKNSGPGPELTAILNRKPAAAVKKVAATKPRPAHQKKVLDLESQLLVQLESEAQKKGLSVSDLVNATLKRALKIA